MVVGRDEEQLRSASASTILFAFYEFELTLIYDSGGDTPRGSEHRT
jgi:hypothetical protein